MSHIQNEKKWKQLAELAIKNCEFQLAQECLHRAEDFGGLLLLASSAGHAEMIAKLAESALEKGKNNVAFLAFYLLGRWVIFFTGRSYYEFMTFYSTIAERKCLQFMF